MADNFTAARDTLAQNKRAAFDLVQKIGVNKTRKMLQEAESDLVQRLRALNFNMKGTFTETQLKATLAQVQEVMRTLTGGMQSTLLDAGDTAAEKGTEGVIRYLTTMDAKFRGTATQPLALNEAKMFERAVQGARSSMLHRLVSRGTEKQLPEDEGATLAPKQGILSRYTAETIHGFEGILRNGMIARKSFIDMRKELIESSQFLQGKPVYWAERIMRTETVNALNKGSWEATRESDEQLGDMVKILSATFDHRTAADSYAVHGEIRRTDEAFQTWEGFMQHPPARPNDREIIVPHRVSWPLPPYLAWKTDGQILERWTKVDGRKGKPPARPIMTTVPVNSFGKARKPKRTEQEPQ